MSKNNEILFEVKRDFATRFAAEHYKSDGYGSHFHRNVEIYGVADGEVTVSIAGEKRILTKGQIGVINCMEIHEYFAQQQADIFYLHIGTAYLSAFVSLYKRSLLPRWLLDIEYNKKLYDQIKNVIDAGDDLSELKKYGITSNLLADIVDHYGVVPGGYDNKVHEFVERVIQYIYDHYAEEITLKKLSEVFCIEPKFLSSKLIKYIGTDIRLFVSDIRYAKALQLMTDPNYRDKTKTEIAALCGFKSYRSFYEACKRNSIAF